MSRRVPSIQDPRLRAELGRVVRFGLVGVLATVMHMGIALTLNLRIGVSAQLANLTAFVFVFFVSFFGHHSFSFRSEKSRTRTLPRFMIAACIGYLASAIVLGLLLAISLPSGIGIVFSVCLIPVVSYVVNRYWVF